MKEKILFAWSSGKDSAMALHAVLRDPAYEVMALLTTVTEDFERISMHGVRTELLEQQARSIGLPLEKVLIPRDSSNDRYEASMKEALIRFRSAGAAGVAFGDLFLEDLKLYREQRLAEVGMKAVFPLWKRDTAELSREFVRLGFRAVITNVDTSVLSGDFSGRTYDASLLAELPASVDPCGENGEFHSFCYDGPIFGFPVPFRKGEVTLRDGRFMFCDLLPA